METIPVTLAFGLKRPTDDPMPDYDMAGNPLFLALSKLMYEIQQDGDDPTGLSRIADRNGIRLCFSHMGPDGLAKTLDALTASDDMLDGVLTVGRDPLESREFRVVWTDRDGLPGSSTFGTDWRTARSYMNLLRAMGLEPVMQAAVFEDMSDADLALLDNKDDRVLGRKETS